MKTAIELDEKDIKTAIASYLTVKLGTKVDVKNVELSADKVYYDRMESDFGFAISAKARTE